MKPSRILLAGAAASLLMAGCSGRSSVETEELKADNQRLTGELTALHDEARLLQKQRDEARNEASKLREQRDGLEKQLRGSINRDGGSLGDGITVLDGGKGLSLNQDFAFAKGSADLNAQGEQAIAKVARMLQNKDYDGTKVIVEGHTDSTPVVRAATKEKFGDNWGLSAMRAAAVVRALLKAGIPADRLHGAFRGEHAPLKSNATTEGKAANRRVDIYVSL